MTGVLWLFVHQVHFSSLLLMFIANLLPISLFHLYENVNSSPCPASLWGRRNCAWQQQCNIELHPPTHCLHCKEKAPQHLKDRVSQTVNVCTIPTLSSKHWICKCYWMKDALQEATWRQHTLGKLRGGHSSPLLHCHLPSLMSLVCFVIPWKLQRKWQYCKEEKKNNITRKENTNTTVFWRWKYLTRLLRVTLNLVCHPGYPWIIHFSALVSWVQKWQRARLSSPTKYLFLLKKVNWMCYSYCPQACIGPVLLLETHTQCVSFCG